MTTPASQRSIDSLYDRLEEMVEEHRIAEARAQRTRKRRNILIAKLITAGETTRKVGAVAKISSSAISQIMTRKDWDE